MDEEPKSIKELIAAYGRALAAAEVSQVFGVSKGTVFKQARRGDLPCFRIGTSVRFDPHKLCEWLDRQTIDSRGGIERLRKARKGHK
jgi:excisionase family DNA binding protein